MKIDHENMFNYFIKYFIDKWMGFLIKPMFGSQSPCAILRFLKQQLLATEAEAFFKVKVRRPVIKELKFIVFANVLLPF
jgi:hypothetical protein